MGEIIGKTNSCILDGRRGPNLLSEGNPHSVQLQLESLLHNLSIFPKGQIGELKGDVRATMSIPFMSLMVALISVDPQG